MAMDNSHLSRVLESLKEFGNKRPFDYGGSHGCEKSPFSPEDRVSVGNKESIFGVSIKSDQLALR